MEFEDKLKKLEALVGGMQSGEMSLDDTIKAFEEGRRLVTACERDLESIRLKIEKVTASGVEPVKVVTNAAGEPDVEL